MDITKRIPLKDMLGCEPVRPGRPHRARCLDDPPPQPAGLPEDAGQIMELRIVRSATLEQKKTWNTVMEGEHYLGANTPPGRLIKIAMETDFHPRP